MAVRQIKVLGCDHCGVEKIDGEETVSWLLMRQYGSTPTAEYGPVQKGLPYKSIVGKKYLWCSLECFVADLTQGAKEVNINMHRISE